MKRQELIEKLYESHNSFIDYISDLPDEDFIFSHNNKWTAAQQLDHLNRCVVPLNKIFKLPKFVIRLLFGKANRESKTYDQFIIKYEERFSLGTNPPQRFIPSVITLEQKEYLIQQLTISVNKMCRLISGFTEEELDKLIMPHPMFGKVTMREMLYFTIHHVKHHEEITKRNLRKEENPV